MRKSLMLLVALAPLAAFAGFAAPAVAESGEGSCVSQSAPAAGPLDLEKIPAKPVAGRLAIQGVAGDDECDDMGRGKAGDHRLGAAVNGDDDGIVESDD